jgi:hypothetical protein
MEGEPSSSPAPEAEAGPSPSGSGCVGKGIGVPDPGRDGRSGRPQWLRCIAGLSHPARSCSWAASTGRRTRVSKSLPVTRPPARPAPPAAPQIDALCPAEKLRQHFAKYGEIQDVVGGLAGCPALAPGTAPRPEPPARPPQAVMKDRVTGKPRGFGFLTFSSPDASQQACLDVHVLDGRQVGPALRGRSRWAVAGLHSAARRAPRPRPPPSR